jgi:hypothetical protein
MNLLIDTNIVIPLEPCSFEDAGINTDAAIDFHNLCNRSHNTVCIHPAIEHDLNRDLNIVRATLRRRLLGRYHMLNPVPGVNLLDQTQVGTPEEGSNDYVDNCLLAAVKADAVDFLISEDKGIHKKASRLNISSRVLFLQDAILFLKDLFDEVPPPPPAVRLIPAFELNENDSIFNTLREDYSPEFDIWLKKCKREGRDVYVIGGINGDPIDGLVILKRENELPDGRQGKTLKLCTFKVSDNAGGMRFGELLFKTIFEYSKANNYQYAYFTAFPHRQTLIDFSITFGFEVAPFQNRRGEYIVWKSYSYSSADLETLSPLDFHIKFGPLTTSFNGNNLFIIPIIPEYHRLLFPEIENQTVLFHDPRPCGNSIKKAYLCHARTTKLNVGDNILFYRSRDDSALTTIGIIEEWVRARTPSIIASFVGTRTVYKYTEIESMCQKPLLAIKFRYALPIKKIVTLKELTANRIIGGPPQSITLVDEKGKEWLRNRIGI